MTSLDRPLYQQGKLIRAEIMVKGYRRTTVHCRYLKPVGRGGLHYVAEVTSGQTHSVPIENIRS